MLQALTNVFIKGPSSGRSRSGGGGEGAEEFRSSMGDVVFESLSGKLLSFMSTEKEGMETNVWENGMSLEVHCRKSS